MKVYNVIQHNYEFRTNENETWTTQEIKQAFENENITDSIVLKSFENKTDALEFYKNCESSPFKSKTNTGYVVTGKIYEIEEIDELKDEINTIEIKYN